MGVEGGVVVRVVERVADVPAEAWDACANWEAATFDPFVSHAFLKSLEDAGAVGGRTGWLARHLVLEQGQGAEGDGAGIAGVMPLYLKSHSQGEYVFDQGWADALQQAGGRYYPKLLSAVPFTPVPGRRLLARAGADAMQAETMLAEGAIELARRAGLSSLHINFVDEACVGRHTPLFLNRTDQQFHWRNQGYATFEDFLASLASRKRKVVRKERAEAVASGLTIEVLNGADIREAHWDAMFAFYMDTGSRKWGRPYLNRAFFSLLGERMSRHCLLVMARRGGQYVAGALNLIGGDCLYGRYWGAIEHHPCLHFELCYYQAIEWAIANRLPRVEAGAQGEHKLARGYLPTTTHSLHWIADAGFRAAVARYLEAERRDVADISEQLASLAPYRKGAPPQEHD